MKKGAYLKTCGMILVFSLGIASITSARTITVDDDLPADFNNIQAAINDANDGDTVLVADGTYTGTGNRDIDFLGKAITLRSENGPQNCIINCQGSGRGFYFHSGEDANSVLDGFTIINGYKANGGGIRCTGSSPHITNCVITDNVAPWVPGFPGSFATSGGGILTEVCSPIIDNCIISNNIATDRGGGIKCYTGGDPRYSPTLRNCIITGNTAHIGGALYRCRGPITNCTICYNSASLRGGGVYDCGGLITNCIIWSNGDDLYLSSATYSCIEDFDSGTGNIHSDPCFADLNNDDYHLKSQAGRWEPNNQTWVKDEVTSPCIDGGDPGSPIGDEPFPNGGIINMGAYGGTTEASKSYFGRPPCEIIIAGDVNGDCIVNYLDFRLMALNWLRDERL
ncbi:MAG: hypothetical protein FVQ85_15005 [Planctomycetes bacterium]|nr:hypothetical protein [Planctomycetota bacterium]